LWKRVSPKRLTPGPAIWLSVVVAFCAAVYSGAYSVITSISVIALYCSYIIPIFLSWRAGNNTNNKNRGPWHLGKYSVAVNILAILWVVFIIIILGLPDNMRAGKTIMAFTLLLGLWYVARERHQFFGPAWFANENDNAIYTAENYSKAGA